MSFEQGPIRPPSEAASLLLRVGRNCPWNKCSFCPVYKNRKFSRRSPEEILSDIDEVASALESIREETSQLGAEEDLASMLTLMLRTSHSGSATQAATWWLLRDRGTVFLQDADPLSMSTDKLIDVLEHLHRKLPGIRRVTAYARTVTLARRGTANLVRLREAGLDRVHVGFESGSNAVLSLAKKGATFDKHVAGGRAAVDAGLELSGYIMPGLGGRALSREHAVDSARCIAAVQPDFIRLRTLALTARAPLAEMATRGEFIPLGDDDVVREIRLFVEGLEGVRTKLRSDHILNLIGTLEGDLPDDHAKLLDRIDGYLDLPDAERLVYRLGRRAGLFHGPEELGDARKRARIDALLAEVGDDTESVDHTCADLMDQWV